MRGRNCRDFESNPNNCGKTNLSYLYEVCNLDDEEVFIKSTVGKLNDKKTKLPDLGKNMYLSGGSCRSQTVTTIIEDICDIESYSASLFVKGQSPGGEDCTDFTFYY